MAFIGLLLYTICIYIRPGEWMSALKGVQFMDIIAVLTIFFLVLDLISTGRKTVKTTQNTFIILFFCAAVASHLSRTYFGGALNAFIDFSKNVIVYFLIINIINTYRRFKIYIGMLSILTLILAIQGLVQYKSGFGLGGVTAINNRIRALGIFNDPNDLALALVMVIPFSLSYIFAYHSFFKKTIALIFIGILAIAIYLTNSRGGMLALMMTMAFYFSKNSKRLLFGMIVGTLLAVAIFRFGPSRMANLSPDEASAYGRIEAWYHGIQMIKSSPLFGIGYGMFSKEYLTTAHNSFVLAAAETGLAGFFLWVGLIYFTFKALLLIEKKSPKQKHYAVSMQASLVGFFSAAFFLSRTYIILPYILFALSAALFDVVKRTSGIRENIFASQDMRNVGLCSLAIMIFTYGVMKLSI